jgi:formylglycine-generating enzyme
VIRASNHRTQAEARKRAAVGGSLDRQQAREHSARRHLCGQWLVCLFLAITSGCVVPSMDTALGARGGDRNRVGHGGSSGAGGTGATGGITDGGTTVAGASTGGVSAGGVPSGGTTLGGASSGGTTTTSTSTSLGCPNGTYALALVGDWRSCADGGLQGPCASGTQSCRSNGTWSACTVAPKARDCGSSNDNDCDGVPDNTIDELCKCVPGEAKQCGETHLGFDGIGICRPDTLTCIASTDGTSSSWGPCVGSVGPGTEVCDGSHDEDCDGFIDEDCPCPGNGGPAMVRLPEGYCIDSTEVTRAQYDAWLSTTTEQTIAAQDPANCSWNTTFAPDSTCMGNSQVCHSSCANHPQVCVDWCDAQAYCGSVGKRLCGRIGGGTNSVGCGSRDGENCDATKSQWYNVCSAHGVNDYLYGSSHVAQKCNGSDYWTPMVPPDCSNRCTTVEVGSLAGCQSSVNGYAGVYDLIGNVSEWEDSCSIDVTGRIPPACNTRGGAFYETNWSCRSGVGAANSLSPNIASLSVGFRCCAS